MLLSIGVNSSTIAHALIYVKQHPINSSKHIESTNHTQHNNLLSVYPNYNEEIETIITYFKQTTPSPIPTPCPSPIVKLSPHPSQ